MEGFDSKGNKYAEKVLRQLLIALTLQLSVSVRDR